MTVTTPETGNLLYTEIEDDLRQSVRSLLDKRCGWTEVLARTESADLVDTSLWSTLAGELGCAAMPIPEEQGGAGGSWREAAVVAEELGRAVAPVPFLGSAGIATALLLELRLPDVLEQLASGESTAAVCIPFAATPYGGVPTSVTVESGRLQGQVAGVVDAGAADILLVPTTDGLYLVSAESATITESVSLDMTRPVSDISFDGADGRRLADAGAELDAAVSTALRIGAMLLASEQLGLAERCLDLTVEYLATRRQFARLLGSYQALKHRLADLWVLITQARAVARYAAECATTGSADLPIAVALAQATCSEVAQQAAEECIQLHGGIGFTWEHPAHLYLKRAKADAIGLGTASAHRAELATLIDIQSPEVR
ncbi:acyl-CoA dehydrogenase [Gordonia paraffinivorans]|uniref:acyl-CoA dehydrogenase family protein n=1 Tax=Gordonia paraffinivorans TaxID=175628 RepID=UPI000D608446|nr:acyl-CoA dehydrogenase family protein [Gordonia paraffinivorans]MCD2146938.1 acyl-CoA/acyl-ACP dehydrogenase [Gordonia paraffinivorans]PWD42333.1 acyl-CoA dehydrogenase [Gordonia paraffinivorans]